MRETQIRSKETFAGQIKMILTEVLQNNLDSSLEIRRLTPDSDESLISKFRVGFRIISSFFRIENKPVLLSKAPFCNIRKFGLEMTFKIRVKI